MGVVIGLKDSPLLQSMSYDSWRSVDLPKTTVNATSISGLLSALEFQKEDDRMFSFIQASTERKEAFLSSTEDCNFQIVSLVNSNYLSNMVAIKPKDGYRWGYLNKETKKNIFLGSDELLASLADEGLIVEVVTPDNVTIWVRLTFLYFSTFSNVHTVIEILNSYIVRSSRKSFSTNETFNTWRQKTTI